MPAMDVIVQEIVSFLHLAGTRRKNDEYVRRRLYTRELRRLRRMLLTKNMAVLKFSAADLGNRP